MDISPIGNKLLIPSRPYNPKNDKNEIESKNIPSGDSRKQSPKNAPQTISIIRNEVNQNGPSKMQVPNRKYEEPSTKIDQSANSNKSNTLAELRKTFAIMRLSIKNKLKITIADAKAELRRIDDIENTLIASFNPETYLKTKVQTIFSEFFSDIQFDLFKDIGNFNKNAEVSNSLASEGIRVQETHIKTDNQYNISNKKIVKEEKKFEMPPKIKSNIDLNSPISNSPSMISMKKLESGPLIIASTDTETLYSEDYQSIGSLKIPHVKKGMGLLVMPGNKIFIAGGPKRKAFIYDYQKKNLTNLPSLELQKTHFSMAFIGEYPGIIGGLIPPSAVTSSVEVFNGKIWETIAPLNQGRSHSHAIRHLDSTFVFGGVSGGITTSIEKYFNKSWLLLNINLPEEIRKFSLLSYNVRESEILLLGGEVEKKNKKSVYRFRLWTNSFVKIKNLPKTFISNSNNSSVAYKNTIYLLDSSDNSIIEYNI